jgi:hypothetical protein
MNKLVARAYSLILLCGFVMLVSTGTASARFLSPDTWNPMLPGVDINPYAYSGNDPINNLDPFGNAYDDHNHGQGSSADGNRTGNYSSNAGAGKPDGGRYVNNFRSGYGPGGPLWGGVPVPWDSFQDVFGASAAARWAHARISFLNGLRGTLNTQGSTNGPTSGQLRDLLSSKKIDLPFVGLQFTTLKAAAIKTLGYLRPISAALGVEIAGLFYSGLVGGVTMYGATPGIVGIEEFSNPTLAEPFVPPGASIVGSYHTHNLDPTGQDDPDRLGGGDADAWQAQSAMYSPKSYWGSFRRHHIYMAIIQTLPDS